MQISRHFSRALVAVYGILCERLLDDKFESRRKVRATISDRGYGIIELLRHDGEVVWSSEGDIACEQFV